MKNTIKNFIKTHRKLIITITIGTISLGAIGGIFVYNNSIYNKKEKELLSRIASLEKQLKEYDELIKDNKTETDIDNLENEGIDNKETPSTNEVTKQPTTPSETPQQNNPTVAPELKDNETNVDLKYFVFQYSANNSCYIAGYTGTYEEMILPKYFEGKKILGITSDVNGIFALHQELKTITIPEGYEYIGNCAFRSCKNLKTVKLPNTLTSIGSGAFLFSGLSEISIPSSVTSIGEGAFDEINDENFTIKCKSGSYAEQYAIEHNIKYQNN